MCTRRFQRMIWIAALIGLPVWNGDSQGDRDRAFRLPVRREDASDVDQSECPPAGAREHQAAIDPLTPRG
jgi:hypothetical protein